MDRRGALIIVALAGCGRELPPLPAAVLSVDTDLSVPRTVTRLRIDVYGEDGTWLHSRDVPRIRPEEWPASFGVLSPDETKTTTVLVRLRAYPEGATRDYRGESYAPRPDYAPPHVAASIDELCASVEDLPPGVSRTFRRGTAAITTASCATTHAGSAAASVKITRRDTYHFEVIGSVPALDVDGFADTTLAIRRACKSAATEIACNDDIDPNDPLSRLVVTLDPGTYYLLTGGGDDQPADVTLRWGPEAQWVPVPPPVAAPAAREAPADPNPRLMEGSRDATPSSEPLPAAAVDRLVRVRLSPGVTGTVPIVLRGACAGTMAKITVASATQIATADALTCVDDPAALVPPPVVAPNDAPTLPSVTGTFLADTCAPDESDDQVVCVPGGDTVLGGLGVDGVTSGAGDPMATSPLPMRLAGLHKFWIDRTEITVGRYRQALAAGFAAEAAIAPLPNDGALAARYGSSNGLTNATFSHAPVGRESYPLNMMTWSFARQLCAFYGGALPTEAQWEYAAASAGRSARATYPWGEAQPDCSLGVVNRNPDFTVGTICPGPPLEAIDSPASMRDQNALGVRGLGGGLVEWTLDAAARYDAPCWQASAAIDPSCVDPEAPLRVHRGGSFFGPYFMTRAIVRDAFATNLPDSFFGARCVYAQPPEKRWRGP